MNEWPERHYYPLEGEPAADPGLGRHALHRGAPRHAASTHPPWPGFGDRDQDLASSPPGSGPGTPEDHDDDPGVQVPGSWSPPGGDLPRRRPQRQVPSSRGRYPRRRRFPRWLPVAGGAAVLITVIAVLTAHPATSGAQLAGRGTAASQSPRGRTAAGPQPVISRTAAQQVLARFARVSNQANKLRSNTLLATVEAGSSYLLDTGTYQLERATDPGNSQYFPLGLQERRLLHPAPASR